MLDSGICYTLLVSVHPEAGLHGPGLCTGALSCWNVCGPQ